MPTLEDAIALAIEAHRGQKDRVVEKFIQRVLPNPIARMVKRADLEDNMELRRLPRLTENDLKRLSRYRSACARIVAAD